MQNAATKFNIQVHNGRFRQFQPLRLVQYDLHNRYEKRTVAFYSRFNRTGDQKQKYFSICCYSGNERQWAIDIVGTAWRQTDAQSCSTFCARNSKKCVNILFRMLVNNEESQFRLARLDRASHTVCNTSAERGQTHLTVILHIF